MVTIFSDRFESILPVILTPDTNKYFIELIGNKSLRSPYMLPGVFDRSR